MNGIRMVVTYNCNIMCSNCKFGCAPYKKGIMGAKEFHNKFTEAYNEGYKDYLIIEGGEVFMHTGTVFKYLKKISSTDIKKIIVTNGFWGNIDPYINILEDLKELGVNEIIIEYDFQHAAFIDKSIIIEAVQKVMRAGLRVSIRSTFSTANLTEETDKMTFEFVKEIKEKIKGINFILDEVNKPNKRLNPCKEKTIFYKDNSKLHSVI
jgi:MoaA/NifB/PqqE/SkfB family radical SAM enzyme